MMVRFLNLSGRSIWRGRSPSRGFSLVEVSLAVAVVAVGLLATLGLLNVGLDASRNVADETLVSDLAGDMLNWARITPYGAPTFFPVDGILTNGDSKVVYFDANGYLPYTESGTTNPFYAGPYYRFTYRVVEHPSFPTNADIARVIITADWPMVDTNLANNSNQRVFISQFARMQ